MKVAIVYPIPFGDEGSFGGGERYAWELARTMSKTVETVFVTTGPERRRQRVGALQVEMYPWITLLGGLRSNPLTFGFLRSLFDVDVIHCLSYSTLLTDLSILYARMTHKKVFITDVGGGGNVTLTRWINVGAHSNGLLLLSRFAGRSFPEPRPARCIIYGGVDPERFRPGDGERDRKVLFVGRLLPHKGVNYLIEAIDRGVPLVVAGRPYHQPYFEYLQRLSAGKEVTFLTNATDEQLIAEYQSSTVVVLPSVYQDMYGSRCEVPELLGLTLLEAMACGTPVICTNVGSMPEIVEHGLTGAIVPPNDSRALADALGAFVGDPVYVQAMGAAARARVVDRFTWNRVSERCLQFYGRA